jgi:metal-sulfur cluster biosynthetic enzyme
MQAHSTASYPKARLEGFSVQSMVRRLGAYELSVGVVDDRPQVELVWEPRWDPERMSEEARLHSGGYSLRLRTAAVMSKGRSKRRARGLARSK